MVVTVRPTMDLYFTSIMYMTRNTIALVY